VLSLSDEARAYLDNFVDHIGFTFPVLLDEGGKAYRDYSAIADPGPSAYPLNFVIDRAGRIVYKSRVYDIEGMIQVIESAL
jgi:peroxiredoxin